MNTITSLYLKSIKGGLPSDCTFLAPVKKANGVEGVSAYFKRAGGKTEKYFILIEDGFNKMTSADYQELREQLLNLCSNGEVQN